MSQLTLQQSYLLCWELLPDRNHKSMSLWYWELMSPPDPVVLPVGTLHSLEWFWVSRRIFIYSHHNTMVFFSKTSVCVCGNHVLVRAIINHPFKLGSPNLDHRCKRPWLRSLLFFLFFFGGGVEAGREGRLTLTFEVKFNFKVKIYRILSLSAQ